MQKSIYIVATPIGNLGDISLRAIEVLKSVDYILAEDTRHTRILLDHYGIKTRLMSFHKFNEKGRLEDIAALFREYSRIALVSDAGTPLISDPGNVLIEYAVNNHIALIPVPGPSALTAILSVSGVLDQGLSTRFIGFMPYKEGAIKSILQDLLSSPDIFVFFDSPQRIRKTINIISELDPEAFIVIGRELTKVHEELIRFKASAPPERIVEKGEFTVAVRPSTKKTNKISRVSEADSHKSETKKLSLQLANYLGLDPKDAYNLLIQLKKDHSEK